MQLDRTRLSLMAAIVGILAISIFVLSVVLPSSQTSDEEQIRNLIETATTAFNDRDWDELAEISWSIEQRAAIQEELEGYTFLRGVLVEDPVGVSDIVVQGEIATCSLDVKMKAVIGTSRWSREFTVTFRKHQGRWFVDAEPTRDAINDAR